MIVSLSSSNKEYDKNWLGNYSTINIKDILSRTKGVGKVNVQTFFSYKQKIYIHNLLDYKN